MKVLIITNLFPNRQQPGRGIFNKQQFCSLKKLCDLRVIAPLPWTPAEDNIPYQEDIDGIETYHPRYFVTPKVGRAFYGLSFYHGIKKTVKQIQKDFDFDVIFATWMYPDAYGASVIAEKLDKPLVVRAHGTDINVIAKRFLRRSMIKKACNVARSIVVNSHDLKRNILEMGITPDKIQVIVNGVDKTKFYPISQSEAQEKCSFEHEKKHILFIGNLVAIKGVSYLIEALSLLAQNVVLHVVGDGLLRDSLKRQAQNLNLSDRVIFEGRKPHDELKFWINAADVLCLPSINEGCPNVVLESLACQTPVVASNVGAIPDLLDQPAKGVCVEPQNAHSLAEGLKEVLCNEKQNIDMNVFSWDDNARALHEILQKAL